MVSDELQAILQSLRSPALILSHSRTIIAVNDGACRLTGRPSHDSLVGQKVHEVGFAIKLAEGPAEQHWDFLFATCTSDQGGSNTSQHRNHEENTDDSQESLTREFWNDEDQNWTAASNVVITQGGNLSALSPANKELQIQARMSVQGFKPAGTLMYLIEFQRPLSQWPSQPEEPNHHTEPTGLEGNEQLPPEAKKYKDRETQVHEIVSTAIPYFTALFDTDGQAVHFSLSWNQVTGLENKEALGSGWFRVVHPDDQKAMKDAWSGVVQRRESSWSWEARYRRADGTYKSFLTRVESNRARYGDIGYWYGSMIDVDLLLGSRQESENRRKSIMALISHTDVSLWGLNEDRTLLLQEGSSSWDPTTALDQYSEKETAMINSTRNKGMKEVFDAVKDIFTGKITTNTLEHQYKDRWFRSTLIADLQGTSPHQSSKQDVQAVLGLTIDISDVKARAELQLQNESLIEKESAAREASELKSRFVANISHELRTPISGIIGMNDLLLESLSGQEDGEQRNFSQNIRSSAAQLLTVINDVLDLSKIEAGRLKLESIPFRMQQVLEVLESIMSIQATRKRLTFTCKNADVPSDVIYLGDPNRLQQVLLNLLSNSIKFTSTGEVTLNVSVASTAVADRKTIETSKALSQTQQLSVSDEMTYIRFIVEDTGCGMTQATVDHMFEAFSQADTSTARQHGGTGLGLTITRQLVQMMGGSIKVTSDLSVGTRAVVSMPYLKVSQSGNEPDLPPSRAPYEPVDSDAPVSKTEAVLPRKSAEKDRLDALIPKPTTQLPSTDDEKNMLVLIIEDNAVNLKIAILMTKKLGFRTITASNGKEALDMLETRSASGEPSPDVILMDCMMPIMDGYEATRRLRQDMTRFSARVREIPIIALTASAHTGDRERCLEAGMNDYLVKPVNKNKLEDTLKQWVFNREH